MEPHLTQAIDDALRAYLDAITAKGALTPHVLRAASEAEIDALAGLDRITVFDDLRAYLRCIGGYDPGKCRELKVFEPKLAWGMFALDVKDIPQHYADMAALAKRKTQTTIPTASCLCFGTVRAHTSSSIASPGHPHSAPFTT